MATVKIKFRASSVMKNEGTLFYQIIHNRVARQVQSGYKLYPDEWNGRRSEVSIPTNVGFDRKNYLCRIRESMLEDVRRLAGIIAYLEHTGNVYTAEKVVEVFVASGKVGGFILFGRELACRLKQIGKVRTAETYLISMNSFARFRKGQDVSLEEVEPNLMMEYEAYLRGTGVCPNTSSFYMRNLRAVYNRAVEKELTAQRYPFRHVYTGIGKTVKRAISLNAIRQIKDMDLTLNPAMDYARDIFMFSFYTRGMSFIDMAFLKKKDLRDGILSYRRKKTNQQLFIKWEKPMQEIVDKYNTIDTPYLLPVIKNTGKDERLQYRNGVHFVNSKLKKIGKQLGLPVPLTTYVARHGWASIAKSKNISISTISEAMGHDSENTTRIYLASLDASVVDKANSLILKSL